MKEIFEQLELELKENNFNRNSDFIKALSQFLDKEHFLFHNNINERCLTHKLAVYLDKYFFDYDVDCEYNRMMKNNEYIKKTLKLPADERIKISDTTQKTVYPDIIIHKRGNNDDNLLVIEVKKSVNVNKYSRNFDFQKLEAFTKQLHYNLGLYLEFSEKGISKFILFKDGEKCVD